MLVSTAGVGNAAGPCTGCPPSGFRKSHADAPAATAIAASDNVIRFVILLFNLGSPNTAETLS